MSDETAIDGAPLCDFHPDHGYASVDGRMARGGWAYMCPSCWTLYGCGLFGTGNGQRLILRNPPREHLAAVARDETSAGIYTPDEDDLERWRQGGALPVHPEEGVYTSAPIRLASGNLVFLWHRGH